MKRLMIKKADHDILNRDVAVICFGDTFIEDITHAACLKQYLDSSNIKDELENYQQRPDVDIFMELAEKQNISITLGHKVQKEDAVYLIYGVNSAGEMLEYNEISDEIKNKFADHYDLEVRDEMSHDGDYSRNNPYIEDSGEITFNTIKRFYELNNGNTELFDTIESNGFELLTENGSKFYKKDGITLNMDFAGDGLIEFEINGFGSAVDFVTSKDVLNTIKEFEENEILKYILSINGNFNYSNYDSIWFLFENENGYMIELGYSDETGDVYVQTITNDLGTDCTRSVSKALDELGYDSEELTVESLQELYSYGKNEEYDYKEIIENIESKGFKIYNSVDSSFYVKDGITIFVDDTNSNFKIAGFGVEEMVVVEEQVINELENIENDDVLSYLKSINVKYDYYYHDEIGCNFTNKYGFLVELMSSEGMISIENLIRDEEDDTDEVRDLLDEQGYNPDYLAMEAIEILYYYDNDGFDEE